MGKLSAPIPCCRRAKRAAAVILFGVVTLVIPWRSSAAAGHRVVGFDTPVEWIAEVGGSLFFRPEGEVPEVWRSDGTRCGTQRVFRDDRPGRRAADPIVLAVVGAGILVSESPDPGVEWWWVDAAGVASSAPLEHWDPDYFRYPGVPGSDALAYDGERIWFFGAGLWVSDGSSGGTHELPVPHPYARQLTPGARGAFFVGDPATNECVGFFCPHGLWWSDGSAAGTIRLADAVKEGSHAPCYPGHPCYRPPSSLVLVPVPTGIVFASTDLDPASGERVGETFFTSDGSVAGTIPLFSIASAYDAEMVAVTGGALIEAYVSSGSPDGSFVQRRWVTDGTPQGTIAVPDLPAPSGVLSAVNSTGRLFVVQGAVEEGFSLRVMDLPAGAPVELGVLPNYPASVVEGGSRIVIWTVPPPTQIPEIWVTDGKAAGTMLLERVPDALLPIVPSAHQDQWFFVDAPAEAARLWRTDGTPNGTGPIAGLAPLAAPTLLVTPQATFTLVGDPAHPRLQSVLDASVPWSPVAEFDRALCEVRELVTDPACAGPRGRPIAAKNPLAAIRSQLRRARRAPSAAASHRHLAHAEQLLEAAVPSALRRADTRSARCGVAAREHAGRSRAVIQALRR